MCSEASAMSSLHIDMQEIEIKARFDRSDVSRVLLGNSQNMGMRPYQEDSFGFSSIDPENVANNGFTAIVADGMGGLTDSKQISTFAVQEFISGVSEIGSERNIALRLSMLVQEINHRAYAMQTGGGSTLCAVVLRKDGIYWCSAGDSRIYLFRNNRLTQITEDADLYTDLLSDVLNGEITFDDAEDNEKKTALTGYIGSSDDIPIEVNFRPFVPECGDKLLLCSDGVYNALTAGEIASVMYGMPQDAANAVVSAVLGKSYENQDNFTAVILSFEK